MNYWKWRIRKVRIMGRDGGRCRMCGSMSDLTLDHIIKKSAGGPRNDHENLWTLCEKCHRLKDGNVSPSRAFNLCVRKGLRTVYRHQRKWAR